MDNINVTESGSTPIATEEINGIHYQKVIPVSETGEGVAEIQLNWLPRALFKVFGRFSFDASSQLRVAGNVGVSGSLTTVTTVTTSLGSIGDSGKPSTIMQNSAIMFSSTNRRNFA